MRRIIFLILFLFSCKNQEEILLQKNLMNISGEVSFIDNKRGFVSVRWECADPPFINQPCFKFLEFPIYLFNNPEKGDTIIVIKVHK